MNLPARRCWRSSLQAAVPPGRPPTRPGPAVPRVRPGLAARARRCRGRGQHWRMPDLPQRQRLESRRQCRPGGRELGRAPGRDVAGQRAASGSGNHARSTTAFPITVVPADQPLVTIEYGTDGADYGDESDPGPMPIPARCADRGRQHRRSESRRGRPARARRPPGRMRALRALQRRPHRGRLPRELVGAVGSDGERDAARGLDLGRRGRPPDPAGSAALRRSGRRHDQSRAPVHRPARAARLRRAGEPLRPVRRRHSAPYGTRARLKADFSLTPYTRRRAGHADRAQDLRPDAGRPGQRMVRDGNVGPARGRTRWISSGPIRCAAATSSCWRAGR